MIPYVERVQHTVRLYYVCRTTGREAMASWFCRLRGGHGGGLKESDAVSIASSRVFITVALLVS